MSDLEKFLPRDIINIIDSHNEVGDFVRELELMFFAVKSRCLCADGFSSRCALIALGHPECVFTGVLKKILSFL